MNLMVLNGLTAALDPSAFELKEQALAASALIARVSSPEEQAEAVEAQKQIKSLLTQVEASRKAVKEPVLEAGRKIDGAAKAFCSELDRELQRLMTLCGNYQTFLEKQRMAAEAAQRKTLEEIERKKQEELAAARNAEHMEAIQEKYCNKAAAAAPPPKPAPKADGQRVEYEWEITVTDKYMLARAHPNCVNIEPRLSDIKSLLNSGVKVAGIKAERKIKSSVRLSPQPKLIEA